jgi:hypothetical protein
MSIDKSGTMPAYHRCDRYFYLYYEIAMGNMRFIKLIFTLIILLLSACSGGGADEDSPSQQVALAGFPQNFDGSELKWRQLLDGAQEAGVTGVHLQAPGWSETESSVGVYDLSFFDPFLRIIAEYDLSYSIDIATPLGISKVDVPADFSFSTFDDPALFARYEQYVVAVLNRFTRATHVVLHTETAGSFFDGGADDPDFMSYCELISKTANAVRVVLPEARVGIYGTKNESQDILACLNKSTDFFGMSYIADRADDDHLGTLKALAGQAGGKAIVINEASVPTSPRLGGSEQVQAEFVNTLFSFTQSLGDQLQFVSYYQYIDDDESLSRQYVPAFFPNYSEEQKEDAIAFFSSLGLHRADGTPKLAWGVFKSYAMAAR